MAFWREQMPSDMFLRSGPDWHLDATGEHTFAGLLRGPRAAPRGPRPDPDRGVPRPHRLVPRSRSRSTSTSAWSTARPRPTAASWPTLDDGSTITAEKVLAVPGIRHFANLPAWYDDVPADRRAHTSDLVSFDDLAGARVVIIGGRQSAYEWAALLCDHGAERVDVVHRHPTPDFAKVSWAFVDPYVDQTLAQRGWWRQLSARTQQAHRGRSSGRSAGSPWSPGWCRGSPPTS